VVPDAQSAAVLVVSWMADDSLGPRLPAHAAVEAAPEPTSAEDSEVPGEVMAPGLVRSMVRRDAAHGRRWLTFGAIGASDDDIGVRGQIDLFAGRTWSLGLAGGARSGERGDSAGQARVVLGATHSRGPISLRAQLGFGVDVESANDRMDRTEMAHDDRARIVPAIDAAVLARLRITDAWGLVGGPIVEATPDADPSLRVFLGVQHGL
jgi:hypothetical protein